jgi:hypothetical protein
MNSPSFITVKRHYRKRKQAVAAAPAVALTLVAASVDDGPTLTMQFNREIDVSSMDVTSVAAALGSQGFDYVGFESPIVLDDFTVQVLLTGTSEDDDPGDFLSVSAASGIVGVAGGAWAGCGALELPYP